MRKENSLITENDLLTLNKIIKDLENSDTTNENVVDYSNWDKVELLLKIKHNLLNGGDYFKKLDENETHWFDAECDKCGWFGNSKYLVGGNPIADTGDYDDCRCPICNATI